MMADSRRRFWISPAFSVPVIVLAPLIQRLLGIEEALGFPGNRFVQFAFASVIYFYGGLRLQQGAGFWAARWRRRILLGTGHSGRCDAAGPLDRNAFRCGCIWSTGRTGETHAVGGSRLPTQRQCRTYGGLQATISLNGRVSGFYLVLAHEGVACCSWHRKQTKLLGSSGMVSTGTLRFRWHTEQVTLSSGTGAGAASALAPRNPA